MSLLMLLHSSMSVMMTILAKWFTNPRASWLSHRVFRCPKCFCDVTSEGEYGRRVWIRTLCRKLCLHDQALQRKVTVLCMQTLSAVYEPEEVWLHSRGVKETPDRSVAGWPIAVQHNTPRKLAIPRQMKDGLAARPSLRHWPRFERMTCVHLRRSPGLC